MNTRPRFPRRHLAPRIVTAALSALIAITLLSAVAGAFQRDGAPFERIVAAEQACRAHAFASEREACVRAHLVQARATRLASH